MRVFLILFALLFLIGCSKDNEDDDPQYVFSTYKEGPFTPTDEEKRIVKEVESRIKDACKKFNKPLTNVKITIIRTPDQKVAYFKKPWKDVVSPAGLPRIPEEGYSGMCVLSDTKYHIFVSTVGDRAPYFKSLYVHERAHTFYTEEGGKIIEVEKFLNGE